MRQKKETDDILEKSGLKENPFGVPSGYFSSMQDEIMAKISAIPVAGPQEPETPEELRPTFITYLKPAFALAAVFGIVFGLGYGAMKLTGTYTDKDAPAAELAASGIPEQTNTTLSEEEIVSIFNISIEEMFASEETYTSIEIQEHEISDDEIEQYLIDSRVSTTSLALLE